MIHDRYDVYGSQALAQLRSAWDRGPKASGQVAGQDPRLALATSERDEARSERARVERELAEAVRERDRALPRASTAERDLRELREPADSVVVSVDPRPEDRDAETAFHVSMTEKWAGALSPTDRREHPLGAYRLGWEFLDSVEGLADPPVERVAWVCAMVACGRAREIGGLELHPLRTGMGGEDAQRSGSRSSDGALAWRCALKRGKPAAARLHFWKLPDGIIEFASVGTHDAYGIPE